MTYMAAYELNPVLMKVIYSEMKDHVIKGLDKKTAKIRRPKDGSPQEQTNFLRNLHNQVEIEAFEVASEFTSAQWLWYLRRLPYFVLEGNLETTFQYDITLAEVISGNSSLVEIIRLSKEN